MVSAMTEGVKNKNRGMQVVKLHVPFLFLLHTVRYQSHRMPRIELWEQTKTTAHLKKENGMEEWGLHGMEVPRKSGFSQMLLQAHLLFWCNVVRRTG